MTRKNRGFTLIEVIVVIAVAAIAFGALAPVVGMVYRINTAANDMTQAQLLAQTIATQLEGSLRYAQSVSISDALPDDTAEDERYFIHTRDGQLFERHKNADTLLSKDGGFAYRYNTSFSAGEAGIILAHITVEKDSQMVYDLTEPIYVHNLAAGSIGGLATGSVVAYLPPSRQAVAVRSVSITAEADVILENEQTLALEAQVFPLGATNRRVVWSVDDPALASVTQDGLLIPLQDGLVTVTATAADGSGAAGQLQVSIAGQEEKITQLTLDTATGQYRLAAGGSSLQIVPSILPETAFNQQLDWSVDNERYATIAADGTLTSGSTGGVSVIVTAKTRDGSRLVRTIEILIG